MVQAIDGSWYAYFVNVKAKVADSTVGLNVEGLDPGVLCKGTLPSVSGISFSKSDGAAVSRSAGLNDSLLMSNLVTPFVTVK